MKFKVKKGKKFFKGPKFCFASFKKKNIQARAYFWNNCKYVLKENNTQINKLFGVSFNLFPFFSWEDKKFKPGHHKNSVRFGWRCKDGDKIEIVAYSYLNKELTTKVICEVDCNSWVYFMIEETEMCFRFKVIEGDKSHMTIFSKGENKLFSKLFMYKLFPYFGGRVSAPHDMRIDLKYLKDGEFK